MTKKENALNGQEIETDSEPLQFEEASSLFENESNEPKKNKPKSTHPQPQELSTNSLDDEKVPLKNEPGHDQIGTIGALLKTTRVEKSITVKIISQHTKISVTNLAYLEADQLDRLPNRTYVIGYIKSYAKILQLDQADCLELLDITYAIEKGEQREIPQEKYSTTRDEATPEKQKHQSINTNVIKIAVIIAIAAICAFLLVLNNTGNKSEASADEKVVVPEEKLPPVVAQALGASTPLKEEEVATEPSPVIITDKSVEVVKVIKEEEAAETEEVKKEEKAAETEEVKKEKISFKPLSSTLYAADSTMDEEEINSFLPLKYRAKIVTGQHNVFISAYKEDSWLTYKSDDGPIKKFVLRKGRTILIRGKLIRIFLGNLGAVKVFRNNRPLNIASSSGVKSLIFPQERASEFKIPLFIYDHKAGTVETSEDYIAREED